MVTTTVICSGQPVLNERVHFDTSNYTGFSDVEVFGDSLNIFITDAIDTSIQKVFIRIVATDENLNEKWRIRIIDSTQNQIFTNLNPSLLKVKDSSFYFSFSRFNNRNINLMEISLSGEILDSVSYNLHQNTNSIIFKSAPYFLESDSLLAITTKNAESASFSIILFDINLNVVSVLNFNDELFPNPNLLLSSGYQSSSYNDSLILHGGYRKYNQQVPNAIPTSNERVTRGWVRLCNQQGSQIHLWLDTNLMSTQPKGIVPLKNGNIIAVNSYGIYDPESNGVSSGMKIFCLDSTLNQLWEYKVDTNYLTSTSVKESFQMILTKDSSLLIVGRDAKSQNSDHPPPGNWQYQKYGRMTKIDQDGNIIWNRLHYNMPYPEDPAGHDQYLLDVEQTPDSGFIAVGVVTNGTDCLNDNIPCQFGWVLKTDKYGCIVPNCHLYDSIYELPDTITPSPNPKPEPPDTTEDIVMILHPNPANDIVNIYFNSKKTFKNGKLRIIDMKGNLVRSVSVFKNDITFRVPVYDLAQGTYIVQYLVDERTFKAEKLVIVR